MAGAEGRKKFTNAAIAAALRANAGLVPRAAEALKTSRQTIQARVDRSPELQAVILEAGEDLKSAARCAIADAITAKDMPTVRWFAERKMRDEGYGPRVEIGLDSAGLEGLAEAIAKGGVDAIRLAKAAIAAGQFTTGG